MVTVQACQQHPLVVMHPNKAKVFPAAAVRKVDTPPHAAETMGREARRAEMLGGHTRVSKKVDDGEVEAWWEC